MSIIVRKDPLVLAQVIDIVTREYLTASSAQDWHGRLERVGYAVRETDRGQVIETLPHHVEICPLPPLPARVSTSNSAGLV